MSVSPTRRGLSSPTRTGSTNHRMRTSSGFSDAPATAEVDKNQFVYAKAPRHEKEQRPKRMEFTTHYCAPKEPLVDKIRQVSNVQSVAIIGGGVSGIVTARVLLEEGVQVTLLEKTDELAGVWAENYIGFGIQVPSALYEFPDDPLPEGWDFGAGPMMGNYICQYAQKHGVTDCVEFGADVTAIVPSAGGYTVSYTQDGKAQNAHFDLVVIATGVYGKQDKFIPDWPGKDTFRGTLLHCSDYFSLQGSEGKDVVTVGYGKSAFDCAQISAKVAKSSTLLFRSAHWCVPRKILGLVPFEYATFSRFGCACLIPAYPVKGVLEKILHAIPGFLPGFWWLVSKIFAKQFGLNEITTPEKGFIEDFWGGHGILPHPDFFPMLHSGAIKGIKNEIKEVKPNSIVLQNGEERQCDVLIAATGYKPIRNFLPAEVQAAKAKDGMWLYRQMILPEQPRLVFLNSETSTFTNITTASIQARWLAELLAGRHQLPSKAEMEAEITKTQEWKRKAMPNAGEARAYMVQTHQVHYYDQLLKDMGASIRRKKGHTPFDRAAKEVLDPYRPRDFDTIVTGEFKFIKGQEAKVGAKQAPFVKEGLLFVSLLFVLYWLVVFLARGFAASF